MVEDFFDRCNYVFSAPDEDVRKYIENQKKEADPPVQVPEVDSCVPRTPERSGITVEDIPGGLSSSKCTVKLFVLTKSKCLSKERKKAKLNCILQNLDQSFVLLKFTDQFSIWAQDVYASVSVQASCWLLRDSKKKTFILNTLSR